MIHKIDNTKKVGNDHIKILYPGRAVGSRSDTGLGTIGRIDHAQIPGNITIKMHPHINDDILSYFRTGFAEHIDSEGFREKVSRKKLMLMKAGKIFHHEEHMPEPLEGLQIFIRPRTKDDVPQVIFHDISAQTDSINRWRLLASPSTETVLQFSSDTWIYDIQLSADTEISLPELPKSNLTGLLYTFQGKIKMDSELYLSKGESVVFEDEVIAIKAIERSELVLFLMDKNSTYFDGGMYSGNQM